MKRSGILLAFVCCFATVFAQKQKADSLAALLATAKADTSRITYMWQMANQMYVYAPDSALVIAQKALFLSQHIKYLEGESRSLGQMANSFFFMGNYPKALEFYIRKLKLEEKRNNPFNLASATMNIGLTYDWQEEYDKALDYLYRADSLIAANNVEELKYNIKINIGDVYDKKNMPDSAFFYFDQGLTIAKNKNDQDLIGIAMLGLAHSYLKSHNYDRSLQNYKGALSYLQATNNEDLICETTIGLSNLYRELHQPDSAIYFAKYSYQLAHKDGFQSREYDAVDFLTKEYQSAKRTDSAFTYLLLAQALKDSIASKDKIRESQILTTSEQVRQAEIVESEKKAKEERAQQLQLLFIGICIPALFLVTLLLSKRKVHVRLINFLGIISLLILFEYLTLLLHPIVVELTHHTPFLELLIFVVIASLLIPTHHRIEHWLIERLTTRKKTYHSNYFNIKKQRLRIKKTT